ncbi:hypothetical protein GCM10009721_14070 [Terrabacter tumescens]|uniref:Uncharacterized protein n=1 Tax=Terrabacter tumescens TaxID=60443 RepID=A0ABQ2HRX4_9MICO|nr:hypothetical protein [Terrabacter tumescens]GGM89920.1 hypothetical protein GCM10009721_14070 [Terrabacter tumescens]
MIGGYASAGAWGARNGPVLIRRVLDRERAGAYLALLLVEVVLLAAFAGVLVVVLQVSEAQPLWLRALVAGTFGMTVAGAVAWVVEAVTRWWWSTRRPGHLVVADAPSGVAATAVLRSRASLVTPFALAVVAPAWCVLMVVVTASVPWVAILFGLLALVACARLAPFVLGRVAAGGVYLTPSGIELRRGVRTARVRWEAVQARPDDLAHGLAGGSEERSFPVDVPLDVTDQPLPGRVPVPVAYLWLRPDALADLIGWYAVQPALRQHLGTRASLEWGPSTPSAVTMTDGDAFGSA